jgi:hypothetical protein
MIILCALVIVLILVLILTSHIQFVQFVQSVHSEKLASTPTLTSGIPSIPVDTHNTQDTDSYCPYRALIGTWRTVSPNSIPSITREYQFTPLPDGKGILLVVRHIVTNPIIAGVSYGEPTSFTRSACTLRNFKCQTGFAGDVSIAAQCVSPNPHYYAAPLNSLPSKFNVIVNSKNEILIDVDSQEEFHKQ